MIGGAFTTYASWRWVFAGEVLIVFVILLLARRVNDTPAEQGVRLALVGTVLSALGLGLIVFGILRSGSWSFVQPKPEAPEAPEWLGLSPIIWLVLAGGVVLALFLMLENRRIERAHRPGAAAQHPAAQRRQLVPVHVPRPGRPVLRRPAVSLGCARSVGDRDGRPAAPSLADASGLSPWASPKLRPDASPRRVINFGFMSLFAGLVLLIALLDLGAGPEIVTWPLLCGRP